MKMELFWREGLVFHAKAPSGAEFDLDSEGGTGPSPIEAFVSSLASCAGMDVVSILLKMRQEIESYRIEVEWERGPEGEWPRPVTEITVRHIVKGRNIDPASVEKAVRLSDEKYCGVTATLRTPPKLAMLWKIEP